MAGRLRVLLVEDEEMLQQLMACMLLPFAKTAVASSGERAIELMLGAIGSQKPFDLVLLDLHLPGMDGIEVLKRLRQLETERDAPRARILMTTGSMASSMVDTAFKGDADGWLCKPIRETQILAEIRSIHAARQPRSQT